MSDTSTPTATEGTIKIYLNKTLGYDIPVKVPFSTPEEYGALVGDPNAWFDSVCAVECYSGFNPKFGEALCEAMAAASGVVRPTDKKKNAKGELEDKPIEPKKFRNLLLAGTTNAAGETVKLTPEALAEIAQKVAADMPVLNVTPTTRASNKANEELTASGNVTLAKLAAKGMSSQEDLASWAARVETQFPGAPLLDEGETYDALAVGKIIAFVAKAQAAAAVGI